MTAISRALARIRGTDSPDLERVDELLAQGERLLRAGADPRRIRAIGRDALALLGDRRTGDHRPGAARLLAGDLDEAAELAHAAADARPYDVDSRIALGNVRLARREVEAAAHEFDEVIGEFGAEDDAATGRRAAILAGGHAPADELPASDEDWRNAARLLVSLWRTADLLEERLAELDGAHPAALSLLRGAAGEEPRDGPA